MFEWLSRDVKRNSFDEWEGRVQLQYKKDAKGAVARRDQRREKRKLLNNNNDLEVEICMMWWVLESLEWKKK